MFHGLHAFYGEKINKRSRIGESLTRNEGETPTESDSRAPLRRFEVFERRLRWFSTLLLSILPVSQRRSYHLFFPLFKIPSELNKDGEV